MDDSVDLLWVHTLAGEALESVQHHLLDFFRVAGADVLQACPEDCLAIVVLETAAIGHRRPEPGVDERLSQRRTRVTQEHLAEDPHRQQAERVARVDCDPGDQRL